MSVSVLRAELPRATPEEVGMRSERLARINDLVQAGIRDNRMPGCVVAVGRRGKLVWLEAYGARRLEPEPQPMTTDTLFDLASLTKPIATATSVMQLWERGMLRLSDRVSLHLPDFVGSGKEEITILQLLTHQSGLIADNSLSDYEQGRSTAWRKVTELQLVSPPGERFAYSDVGFIVLGELVERLSGKRLDQFAREEIFAPLQMNDTAFVPPPELRQRAAPTEQRNDSWIQGEVHDPRAFLMDGVAGHAGLFSTAGDLSHFAQMMLNEGRWGELSLLSPLTIKQMTEDIAIFEERRTTFRGLGWDKRSGYSSNRGENFSLRAFGHGGFTGTVIWMDPELELFVIFLSNRVHPRGEGSVNPLAGTLGTIAAAAIDDRRNPQGGAAAETNRAKLDDPISEVRTGIDVLLRDQFQSLRGAKVGLITNHTGLDRNSKNTIGHFLRAEGVELRAIFSPEHGIAGNLDQPTVDDGREPTSNLPIYSLYGDTRKPSADQLAGIDTLVFDIQDIGCRFYTYISTMGLAMEAAAENKKRFVVLDRPNPINGDAIEGPILDDGKQSFVGYHTIPVRHGMTAGELAKMFAAERQLTLDLTVVAMEDWRRSMMFDETGLPWVNPSPNMRSVNQAILYPGIGLLETTNISVGRGTDTPFELFGAPWLDAPRFVNALRQLQLPALRFTPRTFTPNSSTYSGQLCHGVQIAIVDRSTVRPCDLGFAVAWQLRQQHADQWELDGYARLLGNTRLFHAVRDGATLAKILEEAESGRADFWRRRQPFLLY